MAGNSAYPIDMALTAIAVSYRNAAYVADAVLPRVPVGKQEFKFLKYADDLMFNIPDTAVGRRSKPNEVTMDATEITNSTNDYALDGGVPQADIDNADPRYDPLGNEVMFLQELVALDRERRAAGLVFATGSYLAGLQQVLAGASQFSDPTSSPISVINNALDQPLVRPNQMVFNQYGWTKFRAHPEIVEATLGTGAKKGNATRQAVAELFEVDEVIVGQARGNSAKRGQAPVLYRLWGNHIALLHKAAVPDAKGAMQFGATFQFGSRESSQWFDKDMGMRGGQKVRTGESVKERIVASQAGYFIQNAFS